MTTNPTRQTLEALGIRGEAEILAQFAEVRRRFDEEAARRANDDAANIAVMRNAWIGRTAGAITHITDNWLKPAIPEQKRIVGKALNELKAHVERTLEELRTRAEAAGESGAGGARVDLSLPGVRRTLGTRHPLRQTLEELELIFLSIGFSVVEGPEIETPYYNFEALNIPEHHPARDTMDTFYLSLPPTPGKPSPELLLRTHTSPMQIHTMEQQKPPVRIIVPGRVYRRDNPDSTHSFAFQQIEGLAVDTDITFCEFKGTCEYFVREFLGPKTRTRLRPSYFPFTEPSAEVDASCFACDGRGCRICKHAGWIELFGAGMVDPAVYGFVNYDAKRLSGFAFGMGVERMAMMRYGISDIQLFYQNDVRFLRQFP
ncbi:MAG TPA: phenylalanine--tRNA ligase subunit alpha [Candidatus Acidoferrales bacterium]|nr:phenylalanine--tRNA ligase subunit alpha [Candidatus Acidoferrales bacterium]